MQLYAIVNYQTCGWCKKFRPVLEKVRASMNLRTQKQITVVDLTTEEGKATMKQLGYQGGIPCLIATVGDTEVYRKPGYQDTTTFCQTLFTLFSKYG